MKIKLENNRNETINQAPRSHSGTSPWEIAAPRRKGMGIASQKAKDGKQHRHTRARVETAPQKAPPTTRGAEKKEAKQPKRGPEFNFM